MSIDFRNPRTAGEEALAKAVEARLAAEPISGRVGELRRAAAAAFAEHGLPTRRVEEWKYTDLRAAVREAAPLAGAVTASAEAEAGLRAIAFPGAERVLFVNGAYGRGASPLGKLPAGVSAVPLAAALASGSPLLERIGALAPQRYDAALALNTAMLREGLVIHVAAGAKVETPIHIAHVFTADAPLATFTRTLVVVEEGAQVAIIESHQGPAGVAYQANAASEFYIGDGAHVDLVRVQAEGDGALHLGTLVVDMGREVAFHAFQLATGAATARLSLHGRFSGAGSHAGIRGVNLLTGRQHGDVTMVMDHAVPHCESRELFKTVLKDESHGVFQGKIIVRPDAQKTDGRMMSQALLLGEFAQMDNKPELEIFADDVQCGHGATAGALDDDLLFYLLARGIPPAEAQALLVQAFVGEAVEYVEQEDLREALMAQIVARLGGAP
ncbi:Fe-S cluster assembly protein SufD [Xanthobacter sp. KR7-225]|uniref:Fe-S cluster assembly protein SufD n=1 Tax=Xanthobacter sp. KR7-225 TaxID=3156613 RepID=UPI0032B52934